MAPPSHQTEAAPTEASLTVDPTNLMDLTGTLQRERRIIGHGAFGTVYHCFCTLNGEVAVKAIALPRNMDLREEEVVVRKMKRELGIWRRLDHPNIVPLLGTARGGDFGSDHPCLVSMWMPHGTLTEYLKQRGSTLLLPERVGLIKGSVAGLKYLHSKCIVHGDLHPGNILIDDKHNARLTDLGFSQTVTPFEDLTYLWTNSVRPGASRWTAPELLYPNREMKKEATLRSDIYSLGSIILFVLSGQRPWGDRVEAENGLKELRNPPRPVWPAPIPDDVWDFIERCWSPRFPEDRPSAEEVMSFASDELEPLLQPSSPSNVNVVLFGPTGCGKSSIINILAGGSVAQVSSDVEPCTKRSQWYEISIDEKRFRLWDTTGFRLADGGDTSPLFPYEQAHAVLQNLPDGVNLILLCARKDDSLASLGGLYRLVNEFFYRGRAPIALVVTSCGTPDEQHWEHDKEMIIRKTGIPVQSLPHVYITTAQSGRDQTKEALKSLLRTYATAFPPISTNPDSSCHVIASLNLTAHCDMSTNEATALLQKFSRPMRPFNIVFFGETGGGMSSVINLIAGDPVAQISSTIESCTMNSAPYRINTGMQQFTVWDTMGLNGVNIKDEMCRRSMENATRLIRGLYEEGGVDLLVFCKKAGRLTPSEQNSYRFFQESLCRKQVPVAVVITHLESMEPMERWWELYGEGLVRAIGGDVLGHACVTSLARDDPSAVKFSQKLLESRLSVQAMLEDCVSIRSAMVPARAEGIPIRLPSKRVGEAGRIQKKLSLYLRRQTLPVGGVSG